MQQNLTDEIYLELEIIRIMSRLSVFAIENESEDVGETHLRSIFQDIEKRCWNLSECVEKLENLKKN
jgi:hypothetical protein